MHLDTGPTLPQPPGAPPWYRQLNRYHWFVLVVAALGWLFDCLDQQLFTLARPLALPELLHLPAGHPDIKNASGWVTAIFMIGWASGGLVFGVLGDRIGRAKTMMLTILLYSLCTGLSALSVSVWDFAFYRFITGLGVGGEFAVGVALVAEVMPDTARARALGFLQALSAVGNVSAALISMGLGQLEETVISAWRIMFIIGALPALLALLIRAKLKEPERWQTAIKSGEKRKLGSYAELFKDPRWKRHAIIGLLLSSSGIIGLWGIGFFSADLTRAVFRPHVTQQAYAEIRVPDAQAADLAALRDLQKSPPPPDKPAELTDSQKTLKKKLDDTVSGKLTSWAGITLLMQQFGAFLGMYSFGWMAQRVGRRPTFAIAFLGAMISTASVFWFLGKPTDVFWMVPVMGFFQFSLFAGYAIYFPELFPTHLRSTGTSFCYNVARYVAATGPLTLGLLSSKVFAAFPEPLPWRYAGVTMCACFLIGLATLPFAPETRGQPLPE